MHDERETYRKALSEAIGKGGDDPQIRAALGLIEDALRFGWALTARLGGNCPTLREVANRALLTLPGLEVQG